MIEICPPNRDNAVVNSASRGSQELQPFPDHTQLPSEDGTFVKNFQEHPQSIILTDSINPILDQIHPDGNYAIGQDCGIYWRITDPPEKGAAAPDWFYVPNVPPLLDGAVRRSYVIWQEYMHRWLPLNLRAVMAVKNAIVVLCIWLMARKTLSQGNFGCMKM